MKKLNPPTVRLRLTITASAKDFLCYIYEQTTDDMPNAGRIVDYQRYHGAVDVADLLGHLEERIRGLEWDQLSLFGDLDESP